MKIKQPRVYKDSEKMPPFTWRCDFHGGFHSSSVKRFDRQGLSVCEAGAVTDYIGRKINGGHV